MSADRPRWFQRGRKSAEGSHRVNQDPPKRLSEQELDEIKRSSLRESAERYRLPKPETATVGDVLREQERLRAAGGDGSPTFYSRPPRDTRSADELAGDLIDAARAARGEKDKAGEGSLATIRAAEAAGALPPGTYQRLLRQAVVQEEQRNNQK